MGPPRPLSFPATQILSHSSLTSLPLLTSLWLCTCLPLFWAPYEAPILHLTSLLPLESLTISLRLSELQDSTLCHPALQTLPRIHISPTTIPAAKHPPYFLLGFLTLIIMYCMVLSLEYTKDVSCTMFFPIYL